MKLPLNRRITSLLFVFSLVATVTACGGDSSEQTVVEPVPTSETPSPTASPSPSPTTSPSPSPTATPTSAVPKSEVSQKIEAFIQTSVPDILKGVQVTAVNCPADLKLEAGKKFDCDVVLPQGSFKAAVEIQDDQGKIGWESKNIINLAALEQTIKETVKQEKQVELTIDCGSSKSPVKFFEKVGETFECPLTTPDGKKGKAKVTVKDENGRVDWSI